MNKSGTPGATPDLLCQSACDLRANHQPRWFTSWWLKGESKNCEIQIKLYLVQKIQISTSRIEKICLNWDRVTKKVWSCIYEYDLYDLDIYKYIYVCVYIYSIFALSLNSFSARGSIPQPLCGPNLAHHHARRRQPPGNEAQLLLTQRQLAESQNRGKNWTKTCGKRPKETAQHWDSQEQMKNDAQLFWLGWMVSWLTRRKERWSTNEKHLSTTKMSCWRQSIGMKTARKIINKWSAFNPNLFKRSN